MQVARIERAGGSIQGGRLVSDLQTDALTGDVTAVVSRDREGHTTVHPADALVFAIGITGALLASFLWCFALLRLQYGPFLPYTHIVEGCRLVSVVHVLCMAWWWL